MPKPIPPLNREQWLELGDEAQRQEWARHSPLAWALEYQPQILIPKRGWTVYEPWYWQQMVLRDRSQFREENTSRQIGKTETSVVEAAWEYRNIDGSFNINLSKNEKSVHKFNKRILQMLESTRDRDPAAAPEREFKNKPFARKTLAEIVGHDGKQILGLPANPNAGREHTASHWRLDEVTFVPYALEIWEGALPTLSMTDGRFTGTSTPKGRGNLHHHLISNADELGVSVHQYEWWWNPNYNPAYDEMLAAHLAGDRRGYLAAVAKAKKGRWYLTMRPKYSAIVWAREFECSFDADEDQPFSENLLLKLFSDGQYLEEKEDPFLVCDCYYTSKPQKDRYYLAATDLGRKRDATAITVWDVTDQQKARLVEYRRIPPGVADWGLIIRHIRAVYDKWDRPRMVHDGTGPGGDAILNPIADISEPIQIQSNQFSQKKLAMIENLRYAIDDDAVVAAKIPQLEREMSRFRYDDKGLVTDSVISIMLAATVFYQQSAVFLGPDDGVNLAGN